MKVVCIEYCQYPRRIILVLIHVFIKRQIILLNILEYAICETCGTSHVVDYVFPLELLCTEYSLYA